MESNIKFKSDSSDNSSYESDSEDEIEENNFYSGFLINNEYILIKEIGSGVYSTVWLSYNYKNNKFFAIKIENEEDYEYGIDEIKLLNKILKLNSKYINNIVDSFIIKNNNESENVCIVFDLLAGDIYSTIKEGKYSKGLPIIIVKKIIYQLLLAINSLHTKLNIIHTDIKPENILFQGYNTKNLELINEFNKYNFNKIYSSLKKKNRRKKLSNEKLIQKTIDKILSRIDDKLLDISNNSSDRYNSDESSEYTSSDKSSNYEDKNNIDDEYILNPKIKLADFGSCIHINNISLKGIQTRYYRAPEVILKYNYDYKVDIWSIGCLLYELLTGDILLNPKKKKYISRDRSHIYEIIRLFGKIPDNIMNNCKKRKVFFRKNGLLKGIKEINYEPLFVKLKKNLNHLHKNDLVNIADLIYKMLEVDPNKRFTAKECLEHDWFKHIKYIY